MTSGGRLVVLDRLGRDGKLYALSEGFVTIGSDPGCDIKVLLPTVSPHHATVVVHANQTVVTSMGTGETLVNGSSISVAALRHGDVISVGGRSLRWDYDYPERLLPQETLPALRGRGVSARAARPRRLSAAPARSLLAPQRASMPASNSGKQVAIVQPQRRDLDERNDAVRMSASPGVERARASRLSARSVITEDGDISKRKSISRSSIPDATGVPPRSESRRTRTTARGATGGRRPRVTKIRAPARIDHTKQAALMLMTGHTPKSKHSEASRGPSRPSFVVKRPNPTRKAVRVPRRGRVSKVPLPRVTSRLNAGAVDRTFNLHSPIFTGPKKSALKNPASKRSTRKNSIKFDLSNLENIEDRSSDVLYITQSNKDRSFASVSDEELSLHYSDSSSTRSPSPRKSIHSASRHSLKNSPGSTFIRSPSPLTDSPRPKKSSRDSSPDIDRFPRRITKASSDQSYSTTIANTRRTLTPSPRTPKRNVESYSIVDLVSTGSNNSGRSMYASLDSNASSAAYDTPKIVHGRRTRSSGPLSSVSKVPNVEKTLDETSTLFNRRNFKSHNSKVSNEKFTPVTTPVNTVKSVPFNSTRISRTSRSLSRIDDSGLLLVNDMYDVASPRSSRRFDKKNTASLLVWKAFTVTDAEGPNSNVCHDGTVTPEKHRSFEEATTPMLSIRSLLDQSSSSQGSLTQQSQKSGAANLKRKTRNIDFKSKKPKLSLNARSAIATSGRSSRTKYNILEEDRPSQNQEDVVTPKSAVKPMQEGVKNKHSSEKKPHSKRSLIDNLDESDFVKQLFNSPVKRKLSQSMTEFSRKKLFEDSDKTTTGQAWRTPAVTNETSDDTFLQHTQAFTTDVFVSSLSSPRDYPNMAGIKRLFESNTPENDSRDVNGAKALSLTRRTRSSIKNDLNNMEGVKRVFGNSPTNHLSDVVIKELLASSPFNNVSEVKALFTSIRKQRSLKKNFEDESGVTGLLKDSLKSDVRSVSNLKGALHVTSLRNDVRSATGEHTNDNNEAKRLFCDMRAVGSFFNQAEANTRVGSCTGSGGFGTTIQRKTKRNEKSRHNSMSLIADDATEWLANEHKIHKREATDESVTRISSKSNLTRELQNLTMNTVAGGDRIRCSRYRNASVGLFRSGLAEPKKSASETYGAHTLPIKKRSLAETVVPSAVQRLPIKKRALVSTSTPVKGTVNETINAPELGRVSPIATEESMDDNLIGKTRGKFINRKEDIPILKELINKVSPRMTRAREAITNNSVESKIGIPVRYTRSRNTNKSKAPIINKRRSSLVINKRLPVLSPTLDTDAKRCKLEETLDDVTSLRKTRFVRQRSQNTGKDQNYGAKNKKKAAVQLSPLKISKPVNNKAKIRNTKVLNSPKNTPNTQKNLVKQEKNNIKSIRAKTTASVKDIKASVNQNKAKNVKINKRSIGNDRSDEGKCIEKKNLRTPRKTRAKVRLSSVVIEKPTAQTKPLRARNNNKIVNPVNAKLNERTRRMKKTESVNEKPIRQMIKSVETTIATRAKTKEQEKAMKITINLNSSKEKQEDKELCSRHDIKLADRKADKKIVAGSRKGNKVKREDNQNAKGRNKCTRIIKNDNNHADSATSGSKKRKINTETREDFKPVKEILKRQTRRAAETKMISNDNIIQRKYEYVKSQNEGENVQGRDEQVTVQNEKEVFEISTRRTRNPTQSKECVETKSTRARKTLMAEKSKGARIKDTNLEQMETKAKVTAELTKPLLLRGRKRKLVTEEATVAEGTTKRRRAAQAARDAIRESVY